MKVEWRTILGASVFLGATGFIYWALITNPTESAGVAMLNRLKVFIKSLPFALAQRHRTSSVISTGNPGDSTANSRG